MQDFWQTWQSIDPLAQAVIIGAVASFLLGLAKRAGWLTLTAGEVKAGIAALLAGVGGYVSNPENPWLAALLAALAALGTYGAYKQAVGKRVFRE